MAILGNKQPALPNPNPAASGVSAIKQAPSAPASDVMVNDTMKLADQANKLQMAGAQSAGKDRNVEEFMPGIGDLTKAIKTQEQQGKEKQAAAAAAVSDAEQQAATQNLKTFETSVSVREKFKDMTEDLLQKFEQNQDLLNTDKYNAEVQQMTFAMRMQNKKYIDQLKLEGQRNRLNDAEAFKEALQAQSFMDEHELLKTDLAFKDLVTIDTINFRTNKASQDREFKQKLGEMDIELALKAALSDQDARNTAMKYGSISDMVSTLGTYAAAAYDQKSWNPDRTKKV